MRIDLRLRYAEYTVAFVKSKCRNLSNIYFKKYYIYIFFYNSKNIISDILNNYVEINFLF